MNYLQSLETFEFDEIWDFLESTQQNAPYPVGALWGRGHLETEMEAASCVVGEDNGQLCALIFYRKTSEGLEITWLATAKSHQRQGLMKAMVQSLMDSVSSESQLWLEVHSDNEAAKALYQSLGFKACGERKNYYSDGGSAQLFVFKPLQ